MDDKTDKNLHYLCPVSEISEGRPKVFSIRNDKGVKTEVALFNRQGKFYAISNRCAHQGGPLSEGILEGYIVTCPWHGWKYSVIDGKAPHKGGGSVRSYEIKVIDECIYLRLGYNSLFIF